MPHDIKRQALSNFKFAHPINIGAFDDESRFVCINFLSLVLITIVQMIYGASDNITLSVTVASNVKSTFIDRNSFVMRSDNSSSRASLSTPPPPIFCYVLASFFSIIFILKKRDHSISYVTTCTLRLLSVL